MRLRNVSAAALAMLLGLAQQQALALTAEAVNGATFASRPAAPQTGPDPFIVKAQVLLSRRSISPGGRFSCRAKNWTKRPGPV